MIPLGQSGAGPAPAVSGAIREPPVAGGHHGPTKTLRITVAVLVIAAFVTIMPMWVPLVMAIWTAILVEPFYRRVAARLKGRHRGAALVTVLLVLGILLPIAFVGTSVVVEVVDLIGRLRASESGRAALNAIVQGSDAGASLSKLGKLDVNDAAALVRAHGAGAWDTVRTIAGATANAIVGMFVFVLGTYVLLIHGKSAYAWLLDNTPLRRRDTERLAQAFAETGRGLFFGVGVTALLQGAVSTIGYYAVGLPQAAALGALTVLAGFIPSFGAGLVWVPVTAGLALAGRPSAAIAVLALGLFVSTADNFVRPALSRYGKLELPTFVVLVAMLGGITLFGTWGLLLGPLLLRLAVEGLRLLRLQSGAGS